jgi:hypothetical protein
MKKSNIIVSTIAILMIITVIICITAFKEKDAWKEQRKSIADTAINLKADFRRFSQVEELVLEAPENYFGEIKLQQSSDSLYSEIKSKYDTSRLKIDTILQDGGKKLTIRLNPVKTNSKAYPVYFTIETILPSLKTVISNNIDIIYDPHLFRGQRYNPDISLTMNGESNFRVYRLNFTGIVNVFLNDRSKAELWGGTDYNEQISITAGGNSIVEFLGSFADEKIKDMFDKGKIVLKDNAIINK